MDSSKPVVIIGGGIAGLSVAHLLSRNGVECVVVERNPEMGGHAADWACMATEHCTRCFACATYDYLEAVTNSPMVEVLTGWEYAGAEADPNGVKSVEIKEVGNGKSRRIEPSALVPAMGFDTYDPTEKGFWGYGRLPGVRTLEEVDRLIRANRTAELAKNTEGLFRIAFFQCVGSRDRSIGANYCSQYCCKAALRMALRIMKDIPESRPTIFYIDLQVAGKPADRLLREAEAKGVQFVQGVPGEVLEGPEGMLNVWHQEAGRNTVEAFHTVVLSIGQRPPAGLAQLAADLGIELDEFGFISPRELLDPVRTSVPGVYAAGCCSGPKDIETSIEQSGLAAAAIIADLNGRK